MPNPYLTLSQVEAIAREAHRRQTDKAGRPYAEHLAAVAEGVRVRGGSEEQIAAAWLHDAVEDGALSRQWLDEAALPRRVRKWSSPSPSGTARTSSRTPGGFSPRPGRC